MIDTLDKIAYVKQQYDWSLDSAQKDCNELAAKIAEVAQNLNMSFVERAAYIGQLTHDLQKAAARLTAANNVIKAINFITK